MYPDRGYLSVMKYVPFFDSNHLIIYSHNKPFRVCSLSQTIPVLMWSTTTTVLSLESLLTHGQDFFQGHAYGAGKLNIMSLKKLGMYAMA